MTVPNSAEGSHVHWVQLLAPSDNATVASNATTFKVSPTANDIDGLKKAVKEEIMIKLLKTHFQLRSKL